jgi:radical SAM protein with 4Fe4S-binding SPASM domain
MEATVLPYLYPLHPEIISLETFCYCNSKCIFCNYHTMKRKRGKMSMDLFHKIVDEIATWNIPIRLVPHSYGEPFLNPDWLHTFEYIRDAVPKSQIDVYTNGSILDDTKLDDLLKIDNLRSIGFSVYAYYFETYDMVIGLPFDTISKIEHAMYRLSTERPDVYSFVSYTRDPYFISKHEADLFAQKWGNKAGAHPMIYNNQTPIYIRDRPIKTPCLTMFHQMTINHDGMVPLCCHDGGCEVSLGNANKTKLLDIWHGETAKKYRDLHMAGLRSTIPLCGSCTYDLEYGG